MRHDSGLLGLYLHITGSFFENRCFFIFGGYILADLRKEIEKRRTFAIISHPDAGKTTLTGSSCFTEVRSIWQDL